MPVQVTISWHANHPTIYSAMRARLGREPSHAELCDEVRRILEDARADRMAKGSGR